MLIPVGVLTVLAAIGGLVVIPGVWEPFLDWIDSAVEPLVAPTVGQEYGTSLIAVTIAGVGIWLARRAFAEAREVVAEGTLRTTLEHKLYFDEAVRRALLGAGAGTREPPPRTCRGADRPGLAGRDRHRCDRGG